LIARLITQTLKISILLRMLEEISLKDMHLLIGCWQPDYILGDDMKDMKEKHKVLGEIAKLAGSLMAGKGKNKPVAVEVELEMPTKKKRSKEELKKLLGI